MNGIRNDQQQNQQQNQNNNPVNRGRRQENPNLFRRVENLAMPQVVMAAGPQQNVNGRENRNIASEAL